MLLSEHFQPHPIQPRNYFNKVMWELSNLLVKRHNSYKLQHFIMPAIICNNMQYLINYAQTAIFDQVILMHK